MSEAKQATAWEWWGDHLFEGDEIILAPEDGGYITWTDEDRVKRLIKATPKLLVACENYVYGRKPDRECEAEMLEAIREAKGGGR